MNKRRTLSLLLAGALSLGLLAAPARAEIKRVDLKVLGVT